MTRTHRTLLSLTIVCLTVLQTTAQPRYLTQKLVPSDRAEGDWFGWSCDMSSDWLVVGSPHADIPLSNGDTAKDAGAVYLFKRNALGDWKEEQRVTANEPKSYDWFGTCVEIDDSTMVVGAKGDDDFMIQKSNGHIRQGAPNLRMGAAFSFKLLVNDEWVLEQKLTAPNREGWDDFGSACSLDSNVLMVGSTGRISTATGQKSGEVFVYEKGSDGRWNQKEVLYSKEKVEMFGSDIDVSNTNAVIGAATGGQAFFYRQDDKGSWKMNQKVNSRMHNHGSVCINGSTAFVASKAIVSTSKGKRELCEAVDVYEWSNDRWKFTERLVVLDVTEDGFGLCIRADGERVAVGAPLGFESTAKGTEFENAGSAYVFTRFGKSFKKKPTSRLVPTDRRSWDKFGFSVAIKGKTVAVGSRFEQEDENEANAMKEAGGVFVYLLE